jgi:tRNA(Ile)-lysidine synthase
VTPQSDLNAERIVQDAFGVAHSALAARAPVSGRHDTQVAIAFSGGLDSSVLLDAAVRVLGASRCVALHVHHGLSANADSWLAQGEAVAQKYGVTFCAQRVNVPLPLQDAAGVEAAARSARYRALDAMCATHHAQSLWLAHHADDQAETVLLQLLRGAGMAGLAAMPLLRTGAGHVPRVRPFLGLSRGQLERYARARGLHWIDDESNADPRYRRNALRHAVMPVLAAQFPGFREALARTAAHAASAQRLLDDLAQLDLREASRDDGNALALDVLLALDEARAFNLLRYWMRTLGLPAASAARLGDVLRQLRDVSGAPGDHQLRVGHARQWLRCYRGQVFWESQPPVRDGVQESARQNEAATRAWRGEETWHLPQWRGTFVFAPASASDADAVPSTVLMRAPLVARARQGGERLRDAPGGPRRTLKNLFQARGIPAWARDVPLLFAGDMLLFVPLIGVNDDAVHDGMTGSAGAGASAGESAHEFWRRIEWRADCLIA